MMRLVAFFFFVLMLRLSISLDIGGRARHDLAILNSFSLFAYRFYTPNVVATTRALARVEIVC